VSKKKDEPIDIEVVCQECGKPIVFSDNYGMFCEDRCGYEKSKDVGDAFDKLFSFFEKDLDK